MRVSLSIACLLITHCVRASEDDAADEPPLSVLQKWRVIEDSLNHTASSLVKAALPILVRSTEEIDVTEDCRTGILQILNGAKHLKTWAFKFLDSFGKPPGGILSGTLTAFGDYDQCLSIRVPDDSNPSKSLFRGQYCTLELRPPLPPKPNYYTTHRQLEVFRNFSDSDSVVTLFQRYSTIFYSLALRIGLCVPSSCTIEDIRGIGAVVGDMMHFETRVPNCEVSEPRKLTVSQIVVMCVIGVWTTFVFAVTAVDVILSHFFEPDDQKKKGKGKLAQVISALSLYSGVSKALSTESKCEVKIFHGIRFLSMIWIILGNFYLFVNYQAMRELAEAQKFSKVFLFQCLFNSALALDTLFFVSAFVTGYVVKMSGKDNKWTVIKIVLHKYWRWTLVMMFMVGLAILQPLASKGPLAKETYEPLYQNCVNNWWANVLYLNNLVVRYDNRCLPNSWFLSCEMQLFLVGLIFLKMWSSSKKNLGIILACIFCLGSIVVTGVITAYFEFPPTVLFAQTDKIHRSSFEDTIHQKPYPHFSTWIIGLALGHYLSNRPRITFPWYVWLSGWSAWLVSTNAVVFGIYEWNSRDREDFGLSALYSATHRSVWGLCLAWLTFVCLNGKAKNISSVLSWNAWVPLSRLTLWAYLLHTYVQQIMEGQLRDRLQSSAFMSILLFCGFVPITYFLSLILYLLIEQPVMCVEQLAAEWCKCPMTQAPSEKPTVATTSCNFPPPVVSKVRSRPTRESQQPLAADEVLSKLEYDNTGFDDKTP